MTLSSSLVVPPGRTSARGLWVRVEALSLDLGTGSSDWGGLSGWPFPFGEVEAASQGESCASWWL